LIWAVSAWRRSALGLATAAALTCGIALPGDAHAATVSRERATKMRVRAFKRASGHQW
jgi:hypothetical protein